ncbi:hypothetical protein ACNQF7_10135 [Flavobacterium sp. RSP29]|uniref:hypothetical protein n=1 Tax=Flavobacterium sp. RSP29 TaxID=3401731 RepID=UPI003AAA43AC
MIATIHQDIARFHVTLIQNVTKYHVTIGQEVNHFNVSISQNVTRTVTTITQLGERGLRGIQGDSGNVSKYIAGEILGGQRAVMLQDGKAFYYDPSDENNAGKLIGITNQAALEGEEIEVVGFGVITNMGNLIPNQIYYAGLNGDISINPMAIGICQRIGIAIDANNLKIEFSEPLIIT